MTHSKTSICNSALVLLGKDELVVDADSGAPQEYDHAAKVVAAYDQRIGRVLRSHDWSFATVRDALEADGDAPAFGYSYRYRVPSNCAKLWELDKAQVGENPDYKVEGGYILIDQSGPLNIRYIRRDVDVSEFTDDFAEALAAAIAAKAAVGVLGSLEAADWMAKNARGEVADAKTTDSHEKPPQEVDGGGWLSYRRTG